MNTAIRPNTVVFDIGGVLLDWNPRYLYRKLIGNETEMETFLQDICSPEWNARQEAGRASVEGTQ
jgi:2-haloacid dehalogenase